MGGIFSAPKAPPPPPPPPPPPDPEEEERKRCLEAIERRRRGRSGTIETSDRGVFNDPATAGSSKRLFGE